MSIYILDIYLKQTYSSFYLMCTTFHTVKPPESGSCLSIPGAIFPQEQVEILVFTLKYLRVDIVTTCVN